MGLNVQNRRFRFNKLRRRSFFSGNPSPVPTTQVIKVSPETAFLLNAWYGIPIIWRLRSHALAAPQPPRYNMMERSQVRWAILPSFVPLKVRRMKSLALLWATAGLDCRSLKLYWVSAKALTLPISHHGSSQLSLPSGLIPSPRKDQHLVSLFTIHLSIASSKKPPRSTLVSPVFGPLSLCTNTEESLLVILYASRKGSKADTSPRRLAISWSGASA